MTATSAQLDPDISVKNRPKTVTTCDSPPRTCPTSAMDRLAMRMTTLAELISSPTSRKNGMASSASCIHAVEHFLDDRGERYIGNQRADENAGQQRKRHGHAEIAEEQETERHQPE